MFLAYHCGQISFVGHFIPHKWTREYFIIITVSALNFISIIVDRQ